MKKIRLSLVLPLVLAPIVLAGCASTGSTERAANRGDYDYQYVGLVERQAKAMNVDVYWVNPPRKKSVEYPSITGDQ